MTNIVAPPVLTPPPPTPDSSNRDTFGDLAQDWIDWEHDVQAIELPALAANVHQNAVAANERAVMADASMVAAEVSATAAEAAKLATEGYAAAALNPAYTASSASAQVIGTGTRVFTVSAGRSWVPGMPIRAWHALGKSMSGVVTAYAGTTLTIDVTRIEGAGSYSSWYLTPVVTAIPQFQEVPINGDGESVPYTIELVDTTAGVRTRSLPPNPQVGDEVWFEDAAQRWHVNRLVIVPLGGKRIENFAIGEVLNIRRRYGRVGFRWTGTFWKAL